MLKSMYKYGPQVPKKEAQREGRTKYRGLGMAKRLKGKSTRKAR